MTGKKKRLIAGMVAGLTVSILTVYTLPVVSASPEAVPLWGPYLTAVSETGITVNWKTEEATDGYVEYATDAYYSENGTYSHSVPDLLRELHHAVLEGLQPDTTYHYRVNIGEELTADHTFTTLGSESFTFIVYGDTREQEPTFTQMDRHKLVADRIAEEGGISFVIHTGDLVADSEDPESWGQFFEAARQMLYGVPILPIPGNHENYSQYYYDIFGVPQWYSFDCGNAHFSMLDSNQNIQTQAEWLEDDLAGDSGWKFAVCHHPPYTSDINHWGGWTDLQTLWEPVFIENGLNAAFSAHIHVYERCWENGIHYVVLGNGGAPCYLLAEEKIEGYRNSLEQTLGYAVITIDGEEASMDVIKVADISLDPPEVSYIYPPDTVFETLSLLPETPTDEPPPEPSDSEICIERDSIYYGDIRPGESSAEETVSIANAGSQAVNITLEIQGGDDSSQAFYRQSLFVNDAPYNSERVICSIPADSSTAVVTQLRVPTDWAVPGAQEATFIFWAEAD